MTRWDNERRAAARCVLQQLLLLLLTRVYGTGLTARLSSFQHLPATRGERASDIKPRQHRDGGGVR